VPDSDRSAAFLALNTNKRGVTLDLETRSGQELLRQLATSAGCVIESLPPGRLAELGCGYEELSAGYADVIVASVTPFGQTGRLRSWKAHDINVLAAGAVLQGLGRPDREPLTLPEWQAGKFAGLNCAVAVLLADLTRLAGSGGTQIDLAEVDCWATLMTGVGVQSFLRESRIRMRAGHRAQHMPHLDATLPAKDGFVTIDTPQKRQWQRFLAMVGLEEWLEDPRFAKPLDLTDRWADAIEAGLQPWLMSHSKREILHMALAARVPAAPVNTVPELLQDEHLAERGYWASLGEGEDALKYPGAPFKLSDSPWSLRRRAPNLGEHNAEIYAGELGRTPDDLVALRQHGVT
jgi:crotonobetainyl-CoA:carnitine CoA-transferase CaiB-like acyl-CoA transferase